MLKESKYKNCIGIGNVLFSADNQLALDVSGVQIDAIMEEREIPHVVRAFNRAVKGFKAKGGTLPSEHDRINSQANMELLEACLMAALKELDLINSDGDIEILDELCGSLDINVNQGEKLIKYYNNYAKVKND